METEKIRRSKWKLIAVVYVPAACDRCLFRLPGSPTSGIAFLSVVFNIECWQGENCHAYVGCVGFQSPLTTAISNPA